MFNKKKRVSFLFSYFFLGLFNIDVNCEVHLTSNGTAILNSCNLFYVSVIIVVVVEELNDLYSSPNIVRVIKSRIMRRAGHVARMGGERRGVYRVLVG